jgi:transposase, IS5 family
MLPSAARHSKKGQRLRAGIEDCISVLFRGRGMKRCRPRAANVSRHWWAAAVLANNLPRIADLLRDGKPPP